MVRTSPKYGETYRFLKFGEKRVLISRRTWHNSETDQRNLRIGNVFTTLSTAEAARTSIAHMLKSYIG